MSLTVEAVNAQAWFGDQRAQVLELLAETETLRATAATQAALINDLKRTKDAWSWETIAAQDVANLARFALAAAQGREAAVRLALRASEEGHVLMRSYLGHQDQDANHAWMAEKMRGFINAASAALTDQGDTTALRELMFSAVMRVLEPRPPHLGVEAMALTAAEIVDEVLADRTDAQTWLAEYVADHCPNCETEHAKAESAYARGLEAGAVHVTMLRAALKDKHDGHCAEKKMGNGNGPCDCGTDGALAASTDAFVWLEKHDEETESRRDGQWVHRLQSTRVVEYPVAEHVMGELVVEHDERVRAEAFRSADEATVIEMRAHGFALRVLDGPDDYISKGDMATAFAEHDERVRAAVRAAALEEADAAICDSVKGLWQERKWKLDPGLAHARGAVADLRSPVLALPHVHPPGQAGHTSGVGAPAGGGSASPGLLSPAITTAPEGAEHDAQVELRARQDEHAQVKAKLDEMRAQRDEAVRQLAAAQTANLRNTAHLWVLRSALRQAKSFTQSVQLDELPTDPVAAERELSLKCDTQMAMLDAALEHSHDETALRKVMTAAVERARRGATFAQAPMSDAAVVDIAIAGVPA